MSRRDHSVAIIQRMLDGRCEDCLKPTATDRDWCEIPEGEGDHLCWAAPGSCCYTPTTSVAALAVGALIAEGWLT